MILHLPGKCPGWYSSEWTGDQCWHCIQHKNAATFHGGGRPPAVKPAVVTHSVRGKRQIQAAAPRTDCTELRERINLTMCGTHVHRCAINGTCTTNKKKRGVPYCWECDDYEKIPA